MIFAIDELTDGQSLAALLIVAAAFCLLEGIHMIIDARKARCRPWNSNDV